MAETQVVVLPKDLGLMAFVRSVWPLVAGMTGVGEAGRQITHSRWEKAPCLPLTGWIKMITEYASLEDLFDLLAGKEMSTVGM